MLLLLLLLLLVLLLSPSSSSLSPSSSSSSSSLSSSSLLLPLKGKELDNYPPSDIDLSKEIEHFPDELMRKDILQELQVFTETNVHCPSHIIPPSCRECAKKNISKGECRLIYKHISPSHAFSKSEQNSFLQVSDLLSKIDRSNKMDELSGTHKRTHKKWTDFDKYTVLVAVYSFKPDKVVSNLVEILEGRRTTEMVRSHIKHIDRRIMENAEKGQLPPAPLGWTPHSSFAAKYFKLMNKKNDKDSLNVYSLLSPTPTSFENNIGIAVEGTVVEVLILLLLLLILLLLLLLLLGLC